MMENETKRGRRVKQKALTEKDLGKKKCTWVWGTNRISIKKYIGGVRIKLKNQEPIYMFKGEAGLIALNLREHSPIQLYTEKEWKEEIARRCANEL